MYSNKVHILRVLPAPIRFTIMPLTSASVILQPYFSAAFFSSQYIPLSMLFSVCEIVGKASVYYSTIIVLPILNNVIKDKFVVFNYLLFKEFEASYENQFAS